VTAGDVREAWRRFREDASARALANKQSNDTLTALFGRYRALSDSERAVIDELLAEQLASLDETDRFDALAVIREFRITSAMPQLRVLAEWLEAQSGPGAPYEWAKVNRLIANLATDS
jgi:hypothetical protein